MNAIPTRMIARSMSFARRFLSLKKMTAQANETITELRLTSDTTEIIDSGLFSDVKYAKSAKQMNSEMSGMVHLHWNGVVSLRFGYHTRPQITAIMIIW